MKSNYNLLLIIALCLTSLILNKSLKKKTKSDNFSCKVRLHDDDNSPDNIDLNVSWDNSKFYYKWEFFDLPYDLENDLAGLSLLNDSTPGCNCQVRLRGDKEGLDKKIIRLGVGGHVDLTKQEWGGRSGGYQWVESNTSDFVIDVLVCCSDADNILTLNNCFFREEERMAPIQR